MTSHSPDLRPTREFIEPPPSRSGRTWLAFGALGVVLGLGFAAWSVAETWENPGPTDPEPTFALAAVERNDDLAEEIDLDEESELGVETEDPRAAPAEESFERSDEVAGEIAPSDPSVDPSGDAFFVQVASYKNAGDAKAYTAGLAARGLKAVSYVDPNAPSWYKVRLGPFDGRADAESARFHLTVPERREAYVVPRSNGKYHVQVASLATRAEADPIAKRFAALGHSTKITRVKMGDKRWHCVRIGPFDSAEEAEGYRKLVENVPGTESTVIPFGPPKP